MARGGGPTSSHVLLQSVLQLATRNTEQPRCAGDVAIGPAGCPLHRCFDQLLQGVRIQPLLDDFLAVRRCHKVVLHCIVQASTARLFAQQGHPLLLLASVAEAEKRFGPADALVNNAGVMLLGNMAEQAPTEWERMLDVNVKGLLNGVHASRHNPERARLRFMSEEIAEIRY
ncbi:3-alpha-(or 20-beta)-hydroxysteroid dehydrogenase [compost metagenome]